jgi:hypothetical protein
MMKKSMDESLSNLLHLACLHTDAVTWKRRSLVLDSNVT